MSKKPQSALAEHNCRANATDELSSVQKSTAQKQKWGADQIRPFVFNETWRIEDNDASSSRRPFVYDRFLKINIFLICNINSQCHELV